MDNNSNKYYCVNDKSGHSIITDDLNLEVFDIEFDKEFRIKFKLIRYVNIRQLTNS